jgi:CelD/BcsL family acetyltransferase involved in cellulose biosynthesis
MRVTVVRPGELGTHEATLWQNFKRSTAAGLNPFMSLTFAQAVGRFRSNARVAVVEDDSQIVAFLPFELGAYSVGMPIGYPMNNLQGLVTADLPIDVRWVVKHAGLRGWRFTTASVEQRELAPFCHEGTTVPCPVIDLTKGDLSFISERRRARRTLEKQFGTVRLDWHSAQPEPIDRLIDWKSRKYGGTARLFSDPTARGIVEYLAVSKNSDCSGVVSALFAGSRLVAIHLGLLGPRSLAGWFTSYDPELSQFAPGMMLWNPLAQAAEKRGIAQIDLGAGQDAYKFGLSNDSYMVAGGAVWVSGIEAVVRKFVRRLRSLTSSGET